MINETTSKNNSLQSQGWNELREGEFFLPDNGLEAEYMIYDNVRYYRIKRFEP